jgi:alginate O-acetyltransferase complex protein AlgI
MLFNSVEFLFFFPVVTILYFLLPHKYRWFHLLMASCIFYCAFIPVYIFILFFTIIIDYFAGILIENAEGRRRKIFLAMSIVANVGVLAIFKYYNFFVDNFNGLLHLIHLNVKPLPFWDIILPIGLSFHTFQAMSYTIEVYRGNHPAERHFGIYGLYVMFYPQLVAGPIERPQNLLHQFREVHTFDQSRVSSGLKLMLWGLFKKIVIADRLAQYVNQVYDHPEHFSGLPLIIATVFFAIQIYCDFSGYSDIAIGSARVMGFKLMRNFNRPYFSKTISEFWSRWHISLSTWFRDYLYITLGGNRVNKRRWYFNLFFVFLVSGFWHGANWTFIIWGALHGTYLIFSLISKNVRHRINDSLGISGNKRFLNLLDMAIVFVLVDFAWIFFRAQNLNDATMIIKKLFASSQALKDGVIYYGLTSAKILFAKLDWMLAVVGILIMLGVELLQRYQSPVLYLQAKPQPLRWIAYYTLIMITIVFGMYGKQVQFIYFQF